MKSFREYISETVLFRGHDKKDSFIGEQDFIWFAYQEDIAVGYANHRTDPTVSKFKLNMKLNTVNFGRSEYKTKIQGLVSILHRQTRIDKKAGLEIYKRIRDKYGSTSLPLDKWIFNEPMVREIILIYGFDSIEMTEDGYQTIGIHKSLIKN